MSTKLTEANLGNLKEETPFKSVQEGSDTASETSEGSQGSKTSGKSSSFLERLGFSRFWAPNGPQTPESLIP